MSRMRAPYRIEYRDALTPRQQEVLALVAQGRTNVQIGDALGIGYETVKTHVAEILGKLGVESREEAGALYREQRGLGHRLQRSGHRLAALVATRAALLAVGAVTLVAAAVLAGALLLRGQDGDPAASPGETPATGTPEATPTPGATRTATAGPTAAPTAVPLPSEVAGRPVKELVEGPPVEFPEDLVLYVATSGCANCGFGLGDLWRIYRNGTGELIADHPVPPGTGETGYMSAYWQSEDGYEMIAGYCTGYCGGEGEPSDDAELRLVYSGDGGVTWSELEIPPFERAFVTLVGTYRNEALAYAIRYLPNNTVERVDVFLVPSMQAISPPSNLPAPPDGSRAWPTPRLRPDGELLWSLSLSGEPQYYDQAAVQTDFARAFETIFPAARWSGAVLGRKADVWEGRQLSWTSTDPLFYLVTDDEGVPVSGLTSSLPFLWFRARLDATRWLGTAVLPLASGEEQIGGNDNFRAVLIDTEAGTVHPILGLPRDASPLPGNFSWPRLAVTGDFVRVATGDRDCLNVRAEATAGSPSLGCYADGVLLRVRDAEATAGWVAVSTTTGEPGFVAEAFIER